MVFIQGYLVYQVKFLSILVRCYLLLFFMVVRRIGLGLQDTNVVLRKSLLTVTRGYIMMSVACGYVIMNQVGIFQGGFGHNTLNLVRI